MEAFDTGAGQKREHSDSENEESGGGPSKKTNLLGKFRSRDFLVRRTGASAAALSLKRLQHEITLENLVKETKCLACKYDWDFC